jgi:hypothetical protein
MTRDMQTTNRYEHSLDSAMRPVRPFLVTHFWLPSSGYRTGSRDGLASTPAMRAPRKEPPCTGVARRGDPTLTTTAGEREDRRMGPRALPPPSSIP